MLFSYQDCISRFGSDYKLKKELAAGRLFLKEKGVYSTRHNSPEIDIIMHKYPKAVFTGQSAFFYHALTDVIPAHYYLATKRTDTRIRDPRIHQYFMKDEIFDAGITDLSYNSSTIRIYDRERMLIELMRSRAKIPLDYYKEVIQSYRKLSFELDFGLMEDYAALFRNGANLMEMIQMEVL